MASDGVHAAMYVIRLANGPDDDDYLMLAAEALTEEEYAERRREWRDGDEQLRREFLDYLARHGNWSDRDEGED